MRKKHTILNYVWNALFVIYLATVCYICFSSSESLPKVEFSLFGISTDKCVHFAMFLPFQALSYLAIGFPLKRCYKAWLGILLTFLLAEVSAALTEVVQSFTPNRMPEIGDFLADTIGISLSTIATMIALPILEKNKKSAPEI